MAQSFHQPGAGMAAGGVSRLAPSPTGALHLGNARTFLVNWALARRQGWRLVLRIEDFDTPRVKEGAAAAIEETLRWLGIDWDPWPAAGGAGRLVQSGDLTPYADAMRSLARQGRVYPCQLTRTQIEGVASAPQEGMHEVAFPRELRPGGAGSAVDFDALNDLADETIRPNWRFIVEPGEMEFVDRFAGPHRFDISRLVGDFVVWTKRNQPSYQLAVVVDDHRQQVTEVVRGDDLLDSAARQLMLYRALGLSPEPRYTHLPLVRGEDGKRLAKRHGDTRIAFYRDRGVPAGAIIGLIGWWSGVCDTRRPLAADEFRDRLDLAKMPRNPAVFTSEDHAWLLSTAQRVR